MTSKGWRIDTEEYKKPDATVGQITNYGRTLITQKREKDALPVLEGALKKFPGNPTRSYRSTSPLKVIEEVKEWNKRPKEDIEALQKKIASRIANEQSKIIN